MSKRIRAAGADVEAEGCASYDVEVTVRLGLEAVAAEVGEDAEAVGAGLFAEADGEVAHGREEIAAGPEVRLRDVALGDDEEHDGHPVELVVENEDVVVFVSGAGGQPAGHNVAEGAVG